MTFFSLPADITKDQRYPLFVVAVAAGVAALAVYSNRSKKSEAESRGLKEIPIPRGSLPYFGMHTILT